MLEPERILRLEDERVVLLDQRALPERRSRSPAAVRPRSPRRSGRWSCAARPAIGIAAAYGIALAASARRGPRGSRRACCAPPDRPRSTWPGRSRRCATTRRPSGRVRSIATRSPAAARWPRTRRPCSPPGTRALTHCNAGGLATGGYGSAVGALAGCPRRGLRRACLGRRDAAAAAGGAPDRLGARGGRGPVHGHRRLGRGVAHGRAARSTRSSPAPTASPPTATPPTRSAPTVSPCSPPTTASRSTSSRRARRVDHAIPDGAAIPIEERDPAELGTRFPARNPAFDVTPGRR